VECKHRAGATTRAMLDRFVRGARAIERARQLTVMRLWVVAPSGFRADAVAYADEQGILRSGRRQLDGLERALRSAALPR
jgi:hypothetical protein